MDRRMLAGLLGLALIGPSRTSSAMQMKDPSAAGSVGYTPIDPVTDRLNSTTLAPGAAGPSSSVPTDPTATGPRARIPTPPVGPNPVGLTPQPALDESLDQGYPTSGFGRFLRRTPRTTAAPKPERVGPTLKVDPATIPSRLTWDDSGQVPTAMDGTGASAGAGATPAGRPAPYSTLAPDLPRRQALGPAPDDSASAAGAGRPAPLQADVPRQGRPRLSPEAASTAPKPRPRSGATVNPRTPLPAGPAPTIPATLPGPEPDVPAELVAPVPPSLPPVEPAALPPFAPQAEARDGAGASTLPLVAKTLPDPLPEPPPTALTTLPTGPTIDDLGPPPAGMPSDLPTVAIIPPPPVLAPPAEAASVPSTPIVAAALAAGGASLIDPELQRTSGDPTALRLAKEREPNLPIASGRAAAVGDEVITVHQVEVLVAEKYKAMTAGQQVSEEDRRELINMLGSMALEHLIEQSLVLHEANAKMKSVKAKQAFDDFVKKRWREEKLPPLLQKTNTTNEYELKLKLADEGQSYTDMQETYRRDMLEHDFLYNEIKNKMSVDLIQLKAYYNENIHQYDQPARIDWREIEISVAKYPDRAAARRQADLVRARLARKEDFATVARTTSDGPTAPQGGLYGEMTPGSYNIPSVNDILNTIPTGVISPVIEAPTSFHIVRVESRRTAGPLRFDEVQRKVTEAVFEKNMTKARAEYLAKLRTKTLVRVMPIFAQPKNGKNPTARGDANVQPAAYR